MRALLTITAKDLRQRLRDRSAYLFGVIVPLGLAVIFGLILPGFGEDAVRLDVVVADLDGGEVAGRFVAALDDIDVVASLRTVDTGEAVQDAVDTGAADAGYVLPAGFTDAALRGAGPELTVVVDPDVAIPTLVATSIAEGFAARLETAATAVATVTVVEGGPPSAEVARRVAERAAAQDPPIALADATTDTRRLDATTYLAAGMAVFFLFFTVQFGVFGLLEERENGTLDRLRAAPIGAVSVYGAKMLTSVVLGVVSMAILVVASALLLGADWGDPLGVAVLVVAGVFAASGLVAVVAVVARTAEQASTWQAIIAIVLGMLGGSFFPVTTGPDILATLAAISPHHWFLRGLGDLQGGGGPAAALPAAVALLAFAGGAALLAAILPSRDAR